ncbi:MAG: hypothetical protein Q9160_003997 [Pyrenula sp. 1 TL-2023]
MSLTLDVATDSDVPTITALLPHAFASDLPYQTIFPLGSTPAYLSHYTAIDIEEFRNSTTLSYLKVIDPADDNRIVGFAGFFIFDEQSPEDLAKPNEHKFPPDARHDLGTRLFEEGGRKRHAIMGGKPYVFLAVLGTHPDYQGRGAGALCMKWGTEAADRLGVPCYLESTKAGQRLYRKWGFKEVDKFRVDLAPYREDEVWHLCMVRQAVGTLERD